LRGRPAGVLRGGVGVRAVAMLADWVKAALMSAFHGAWLSQQFHEDDNGDWFHDHVYGLKNDMQVRRHFDPPYVPCLPVTQALPVALGVHIAWL
jgi:hypothetical protein